MRCIFLDARKQCQCYIGSNSQMPWEHLWLERATVFKCNDDIHTCCNLLHCGRVIGYYSLQKLRYIVQHISHSTQFSQGQVGGINDSCWVFKKCVDLPYTPWQWMPSKKMLNSHKRPKIKPIFTLMSTYPLRRWQLLPKARCRWSELSSRRSAPGFSVNLVETPYNDFSFDALWNTFGSAHISLRTAGVLS